MVNELGGGESRAPATHVGDVIILDSSLCHGDVSMRVAELSCRKS